MKDLSEKLCVWCDFNGVHKTDAMEFYNVGLHAVAHCEICTRIYSMDYNEWVAEGHCRSVEEFMFLTDTRLNEATLRMRMLCCKKGHKPFEEHGIINGCACGWVKLDKPVPVPTPTEWSQIPDAVLIRGKRNEQTKA